MTERKPWEGEFPLDDPEDMDDEAIRILLRNLEAGRDKPREVNHG